MWIILNCFDNDSHTEGAEHNEGKRVANNPFANSSYNHEDAAEEEVRTFNRDGLAED